MNNHFLTFDPIQIKSFGGEYVISKNYEYRYFNYKKFKIFDSIYIPNGPILFQKNDIDIFFEDLNKYKFSKIKIDLPLLLADGLKEYLHLKFKKLNFKKSEYIQDCETILINKNNEKIDNKEVRYYEKKALNKYTFEVLENISQDQINEIFAIYVQSAKYQNYTPKSKEVFLNMQSNSIVGIAKNNNGGIDGFVWGYKYFLKKNVNLDNEYFSIVDTVFIGTNLDARNSYAGYGLHKKFFEYLLYKKNIDYINFEGASRNQNRKYLSFKKSFGGEFYPLGGSYEKIQFI